MSELTFLLPYLGRWDQFRKSRFHRITDRLAEAGHEIHVIQAPATDSEEVTFSRRDIELPETVTLHDADLRPGIWDAPFANKVFQKGYYGIGVRAQVRRLIETEDIDILWLYNLPHYPLALIDDVPIAFDVVDDYIAMLNHELGVPSSVPIRGIEEFAFAQLLKHASLITVISHELQRDVERMIGSSVPTYVVPNGVDTDVFSIQTDPPRTPQEPPVVGFVGSFEYFIDFDLILDAAAALPDVEFLLVGDGREFEYVQSQVDRRNLENVQLPGLVESSAVPEYIRRMDICLNTFERTPLSHAAVPLKLFEYLSQGRPVISTRIHEVQYIDDGYLTYADTKSELTDAIEGILADYETAVDRTVATADLLEDTYNWDAIAQKFEQTVTNYLGPR
jgi:glycosyltransferase involved in cell wall biosynthesis